MVSSVEGTSGQSFALGIDLGGTTVRTAIFNPDWSLLDCITLPTRIHNGPQAVVDDMAASVNSLMRKFGVQLQSVGLGSPGPLDLDAGCLLKLPNFPGWDFFPIRKALSNALDMQVILESDANAAALAEWQFGAGQACKVDSMCMLTLGTGVGGGLIFNGKIWHGLNGMAGEFGHVSIFPDGVDCSCGGRGCLERYASSTAIAANGRRWLLENEPDSAALNDPGVFSARTMAEMAHADHAGMRKIFDEVGHALGLSVASSVNVLDLPLYVIGGGVADAWELFAPSLLRTVRAHSYVYQLSEPRQKESMEKKKPFITFAKLGPQAGLLGAALLSCADRLDAVCVEQ